MVFKQIHAVCVSDFLYELPDEEWTVKDVVKPGPIVGVLGVVCADEVNVLYGDLFLLD